LARLSCFPRTVQLYGTVVSSRETNIAFDSAQIYFAVKTIWASFVRGSGRSAKAEDQTRDKYEESRGLA
jgi:hypothetical protein